MEGRGCPAEWLSGSTGGFLCAETGGCSAWTEEGGEFPRGQCADQCSIGLAPARAKRAAPPAAAAGAPSELAGHEGPQQGEALPEGQQHDQAPAEPASSDEPADDEGLIQPCGDGEAECPEDWATGAHGGYFCRTTKGCAAWSKDGGAFPEEVCPDQCSVGNTPSTRTNTTTSITVIATYPSMGIALFCWSLAAPGYEADLLRRQLELNAGIFACDDQMVMSFDEMTIGAGEREVNAVVFERLESGISKDGTSANTAQFMKAWEVVRDDGRYAKNDWTVKVDPDAVLLPDRLRIHLVPHQGANTYIRNCDKPMSEGTMMFGSLEALSKSALDGYYANFDACSNELPWQEWGEDLFLMRCLEHIGTVPAEDFGLVQDGVCKGVWCGDSFAAAFHPMKDVPAWEACWNEAVAAR